MKIAGRLFVRLFGIFIASSARFRALSRLVLRLHILRYHRQVVAYPPHADLHDQLVIAGHPLKMVFLFIAATAVLALNAVSPTDCRAADGAEPLFWRSTPPGSPGNFTPLRLEHDGSGYFYTSTTAGRGHDVVNGRRAGSLLRLSEATGQIDPDFRWNEALGSPTALVLRSDGRLLVAVSLLSGEGATVVCVDSAGTHDSSFVAPFFNRNIRQLALQADGKVLVMADGAPVERAFPGAQAVSALYRLHLNGALDIDFARPEILGGIFAQPVVDVQGRIYVAGQIFEPGGIAVVRRFSTLGTPDTEFSSNLASSVSGLSGVARAVHIQSDGKVVIVGRFMRTGRGSSADAMLAIRLNEDGSYDHTYAQLLRSEAGISNSSAALRGALPDENGGVVVASTHLFRLSSTGAVDPTFAAQPLPRECFSLSRSRLNADLFVTDLADVAGENWIGSFTSAGAIRAEFVAAGFGFAMAPRFAHFLPDGRVFLGGTFNRSGSTITPGSIVLDEFGEPLSQSTPFHDPGNQVRDPALDIGVAPDGTFLLRLIDNSSPQARSDGLRWFSASGENISPWDGTVFPPVLLKHFVVGPERTIFTWNEDIAPNSALTEWGRAEWLKKLAANGSQNNVFAPDLSWLVKVERNPADQFITNLKIGRILAVRARADGGADVCGIAANGEIKIVRFTATGARQTEFLEPTLGYVNGSFSYTGLLADPVTGASYQWPQTRYNWVSWEGLSDWLVLPDGTSYLAGQFVTGQQTRGIVRVLSDGKFDETFDSAALQYEGPLPLAARGNALAADDKGRVYVAGRFTSVRGAPRRGLARIDQQGQFDLEWDPQVEVSPLPKTVILVAAGNQLNVFGSVKLLGDSSNAGHVVLSIDAEGFTGFLEAHFSGLELADSQVSGMHADPDGDGLSNLVEYALGLHPRNASTSNLPQAGTTATHWTYTYTRPADRGDLVYTAEASTNLTAWNVLTPTHEMIGSQDGLQIWRASVPLNSGTSVFFRLRVATASTDQ